MTLSSTVREAVEAVLGAPVLRVEPVGGGCVARATRVETAAGSAFLKWGSGEVARWFGAEAAGLEALRAAAGPLRIPRVLAVRGASEDHDGLLLLEWIETVPPPEHFWERFGEGLAALHRSAADRYGFERATLLGRLPQENGWMKRWPAFFRARRLEPQVARARREGRWQRAWDAPLEVLYRRLPELLPEEPPASLLHGDLWSGNFMIALEGAVLVDPAAYYGDREADLAMTELFGGFDRRFYAAYRAAWPVEPAYEERKAVYNLYHLVNHLNHFGGSYADSIAASLRRFA